MSAKDLLSDSYGPGNSRESYGRSFALITVGNGQMWPGTLDDTRRAGRADVLDDHAVRDGQTLCVTRNLRN